MARILNYAAQNGYVAYTSTLAEAWRLSIHGLSASLLDALSRIDTGLELHPDEDYTHDSITLFGIQEAKRHRQRGISIGMFMGLFKYYRQGYLDLVESIELSYLEKSRIINFFHRFFDRIELGLCSEWVAGSDAERIVELQATNRTMTNEKNKYLTLFESLSQPVILLDQKGTVARINQAAAEWLNVLDDRHYSIDDDLTAINRNLQGKCFDTIFPWLQEILHKVDTSHKTIVEHHRIRLDNRYREMDVLCSAMCDVSQKFDGFVLVFSDRSKEYDLIAELQTTQTQLTASNKRLEQFAYAASHDLREPLRMISSYLELLLEQYAVHLDERGNRFLHHARSGASRLQAMIDSLLDLSRLHSSGRDVQRIPMAKVVASAIEGMKERIRETSAEINIGNLPEVLVDKTQMILVMQNLISNAIKFHKGLRPTVSISGRRKMQDWLIAVEDNGIGIGATDRERIFQAFARLHSHQEYEGTGLGLAICQAIIERHGGRIWVESAAGGGSVFYFSLPETPEMAL